VLDSVPSAAILNPLLVFIFTTPSAELVAIGRSDAVRLVDSTPVLAFIASPLPTLIPPSTPPDPTPAIGKVYEATAVITPDPLMVMVDPSTLTPPSIEVDAVGKVYAEATALSTPVPSIFSPDPTLIPPSTPPAPVPAMGKGVGDRTVHVDPL
jgi:hypothetical protein